MNPAPSRKSGTQKSIPPRPVVELHNRTRIPVPEARLRSYAARIMALIPQTRFASVDITFVGERSIRSLNAQYRGKDKTTDVLSFRLDDEPAPGEPFGAVVICTRYARDQAAAEGMPLVQMCEELILHSLLHLTGSDHESDSDHKAMEKRKARILRQLKS